MLQAAHEQLTEPGTRRGETCCYCCREALESVLGPRRETRLQVLWNRLDAVAKVLDDDPAQVTIPRSQFDGYSGAVREADEEHSRRLQEVIRGRIGERPTRFQGDLFTTWNDLLKRLNRGVHQSATVEEAAKLYRQTLSVVGVVFPPMSMRLEKVDALLKIESPSADDVSELVLHAADQRHLHYFFSQAEGDGWFEVLREHELLLPSADGSSWSALPYLSRLAVGEKSDRVAEWMARRVAVDSWERVWSYMSLARRVGTPGRSIVVEGLRHHGRNPRIVEAAAAYVDGTSGPRPPSEAIFEIADRALSCTLSTADESHVLQRLIRAAVDAAQNLDADDCLQVFVKKLNRQIVTDERPLEYMQPLERLSTDVDRGSATELLVAAVIELLEVARAQRIDLPTRLARLDGLPATAVARIRSHHLLGEVARG
jgi:hypothetical protein